MDFRIPDHLRSLESLVSRLACEYGAEIAVAIPSGGYVGGFSVIQVIRGVDSYKSMFCRVTEYENPETPLVVAASLCSPPRYENYKLEVFDPYDMTVNIYTGFMGKTTFCGALKDKNIMVVCKEIHSYVGCKSNGTSNLTGLLEQLKEQVDMNHVVYLRSNVVGESEQSVDKFYEISIDRQDDHYRAKFSAYCYWEDEYFGVDVLISTKLWRDLMKKIEQTSRLLDETVRQYVE